MDLGAVFLGRAGGILATLLFVPRYQHLLTPLEFGVVAVVLSMQALFLTFDLGLSAIVGTEIAAARDETALSRARGEWHHGELFILGIALVVAVAALGLSLTGALGTTNPIEITLSIALVTSLLLANIAQAGMIALQNYRLTTFLTCLFTLLRGLVALSLMILWRAEILSFLIGQASISLVHALVMRSLLIARVDARLSTEPSFKWSRDSVSRLWGRSGPMMIYALAGAGAVQLDKTIVARVIGLDMAGIYYLATTYALTPIAVLGGPVYQYFLPKVAASEGAEANRVAHHFQFLTVAAVVAPTAVLVFYSDTWLAAWLPRSDVRGLIAPVAKILIVGAAISATGYYPTARLLAGRQEKFLSRLSGVLTIIVLTTAVLVTALFHSLQAIAVVYFLYYLVGCIALWLRVRPSKRFVWTSYALPAFTLTASCAATCLAVRAELPGMAGAFVATALCALETAVVGAIWWGRYGYPSSPLVED